MGSVCVLMNIDLWCVLCVSFNDFCNGIIKSCLSCFMRIWLLFGGRSINGKLYIIFGMSIVWMSWCMILMDGCDCVVYVVIFVSCCDVVVVLCMIFCMWCFYCNCLCSVILRYVYVFIMVILKEEKVSVNEVYVLGNVFFI